MLSHPVEKSVREIKSWICWSGGEAGVVTHPLDPRLELLAHAAHHHVRVRQAAHHVPVGHALPGQHPHQQVAHLADPLPVTGGRGPTELTKNGVFCHSKNGCCP